MKKMLPLTLLFSSLTLAGPSTMASSFAPEPNLNLSFSAQRSLRFENARTSFAYGDKTLTVSLQPVMPECPQDRLCIQIFPSPIAYELSDVATSKNTCGVLTTTARDDRRPVDGALVALKIVDYSSNTCGYQVNRVQMDFSTEIFSRGMKKPVRTLDKFLSVPSQAVYGAELAPEKEGSFATASVTIDGRTARVDLTLTELQSPCTNGEGCDLLEPQVSYKLKNARIRTNECGIVQTIAGFDDTPVDGIELKVTINNNLGNICPSPVPLAAIDMILEQRYLSRLGGETKVVDTFHGDNIRFIKPSK